MRSMEFPNMTETLMSGGNRVMGNEGTLPVMPSVHAQASKSGVARLTEAERRRAVRIADRIHADLVQVVNQLPEAVRGGSGLSRHLSMPRNTCQRISHALQDGPSLITLARLPGVKGLQQFTERALGKGVTPESADLLTASISEFSRLINDIAGSHTKLMDRIDASREGREGGGFATDHDTRASLYAAAAQLTGGGCRTAVSLNIIDLHDEHTLSRTYIHGYIGAVMTRSGMPLVVTSGDNLRWAKEGWDHRLLDDRALKGRTPSALVEEFTSSPLPEITGRGKDGQLLQVIDPRDLDEERAFDVVTATRTRWPLMNPETKECAFERVWYLVNWPVQNLVFDVYLHERLERMFRPSVDALMWYPGLSIPGGDKWATRFPTQTKLELLGRGTEAAHSGIWPKHAELTKHAFQRVGVDAEQYVGFRCEVRYPIWRAGYCMSFEEIGGVKVDQAGSEAESGA